MQKRSIYHSCLKKYSYIMHSYQSYPRQDESSANRILIVSNSIHQTKITFLMLRTQPVAKINCNGEILDMNEIIFKCHECIKILHLQCDMDAMAFHCLRMTRGFHVKRLQYSVLFKHDIQTISFLFHMNYNKGNTSLHYLQQG